MLPETTPAAPTTLTPTARLFELIQKQHGVTALAVKYLNEGIIAENAKRIPFDNLVRHLRKKEVIDVTETCLKRIHDLCLSRNGNQLPHTQVLNSRIFLAAYMTGYRPTRVFEHNGQREKDLTEASRDMIETFEAICTLLKNGVPFSDVNGDLVQTFPRTVAAYFELFMAWRGPNTEIMTTRTRHALTHLYNERTRLQRDASVPPLVIVNIQNQILALRANLQMIAGPDALADFDREHGIQNPIENENGRVGEGGGGNGPTGQPNQRFFFEGVFMKPDQLGYEVLYDPNFQFPDYDYDQDYYSQTNKPFHDMHWNQIIEDFQETPMKLDRMCMLLVEIRDGLNTLIRPPAIYLNVDLESIKNQAENGQFSCADFKVLINTFVDKIKEVQKPAREHETNFKWEIISKKIDEATPEQLPNIVLETGKFLWERLGTVRIDFVNGHIKLISGVLVENGVGWAREKFDEAVQTGQITLETTKTWLSNAIVKGGTQPEVLDVVSEALLNLIRGPEISESTLPAILRFDLKRVSHLKQTFGDLCKIIAVMEATKITIYRLEELSEDTQSEFCHLVDAFYAMTPVVQWDRLDQVFVDQVLNRSEVPAHFWGLIADSVKTAMEPANIISVDRRISEVAVLYTKGYILPSLTPRIEGVATNFKKLLETNYKIYQPFYDKIVEEIVEAEGEA